MSHSNHGKVSNRYSGPSSPGYFSYQGQAQSYPSSPGEGPLPSPTDAAQLRLPSLRTMHILPSINTFSDPPSRASLSPYEHYPASSYFASGPYSPHHVGPAPLPTPLSANERPVNKKGPWTKTEDDLLMQHVTNQQHANGSNNVHWGDVSKMMYETRTAKQCRERWTQNLAPGLNRLPITDEEAAFIRDWVSKHGTQWAELSRQPEVRGRSDNHLKNWWNGQRKQDQDRDQRAQRKANARRSSGQSPSHRGSASPSSQRPLPSASPGSNSIPSSVSPPQFGAPTSMQLPPTNRTLPRPQPQPQQSSTAPYGRSMTVANLLN